MQQSSSLFRRHGLVAALVVILAASAPTPVAAQDDKAAPALVIELSDWPAAELATFGYAEPVLVTYTEAGWAAVVFTENPNDFPELLKDLFVADVPGCIPEGANVCCDENSDTYVINTAQGWMRLGERCEPDLPLDYDYENDDEPGVDLAIISDNLATALRDCCDIIDTFVDLANPDGTARMLINPLSFAESQKSEHSPSMLAPPRPIPAGFTVRPQPRSPVILAHDHRPPRFPCVFEAPDACRKQRKKVCHKDLEHLYRKIKVFGVPMWCHRAGCSCP